MGRMMELIDGLMSWVCEHTDGIDEYVIALRQCGFTDCEIETELYEVCGFTKEDVEIVMKRCME